MKHFVKKSFGLVLFVAGLTASAFSLLVVTILATEPDIPLALTLVVAAILCGVSFPVTYAGWRLWKGRKRPVQPLPTADGKFPEPVRPLGKPKSSGKAKPAVGAAGPVTLECPGCGAPVKAVSSDPFECEYCGNQIHVGS